MHTHTPLHAATVAFLLPAVRVRCLPHGGVGEEPGCAWRPRRACGRPMPSLTQKIGEDDPKGAWSFSALALATRGVRHSTPPPPPHRQHVQSTSRATMHRRVVVRVARCAAGEGRPRPATPIHILTHITRLTHAHPAPHTGSPPPTHRPQHVFLRLQERACCGQNSGFQAP